MCTSIRQKNFSFHYCAEIFGMEIAIGIISVSLDFNVNAALNALNANCPVVMNKYIN